MKMKARASREKVSHTLVQGEANRFEIFVGVENRKRYPHTYALNPL